MQSERLNLRERIIQLQYKDQIEKFCSLFEKYDLILS